MTTHTPLRRTLLSKIWLWLLLSLLVSSLSYGQVATEGTTSPTAVTATLDITITGTLVLCKGASTQIQATVPAAFTQNWYWLKDGVKVGTDRQQTITVTDTEGGVYTLGGDWVNDPTVAGPGSANITFQELPQADIVARSASVCAGQSFTLLASPDPVPTTNRYEWFLPDGTPTGNTSSTLLVDQPGAYSLVVTDTRNCAHTATTPNGLIKIEPNVSLSIVAGSSAILCEGESVELTLLNSSRLTDFNWVEETNGPVAGASNVSSFTATQPGVYNVVGTLAACASPPASLTVQVSPKPIVSATISPSIICQGFSNPYRLTADVSNVPISTFRWLDPASTLVGTSSEIESLLPGTFSLTATSAAGCSTTLTVAGATIQPSYSLSITASGSLSFCEGDTRTLTANGGGGPLAGFVWARDDQELTPSVDAQTPLPVTESGEYSLKATTIPVCTILAPAVSLTANPIPTATLSANQPTVCEGIAYTLSVQPDATGNTYQWRGASNALAGMGSQLTTTQPGPFELRVTRAGCSTTVSSQGLVTFNPSTTLTVTPANVRICEGSSTTLTVSGGDVSAYYWTRDGSGKEGGSDGQTTLPVSVSGTYRLGGTFPDCVFAPNQATVQVTEIPVATVVPPASPTICIGDAYQLRPGSIRSDYTYQWTNLTTGQVESNAATFTTTKTDPYRLRIQTLTPCSYTTVLATPPTFRPVTNITITASGSLQFCQGEARTLTAQVGTLTGYGWSRDNVPLAGQVNQPNLPIGPLGPGTYTYRLTNLPLCTRVPVPPQLVVRPLPGVSVVPNTTTLCEGQTAQLVAQTVPVGSPVRWERNGVVLGTFSSLTANTAATYSVTATSPFGCTNTSQYTFPLQVFPLPVFSLTPPDPIWQNTGVRAGNAPENPDYSYQWFPPTGLSDPTVARPFFNPSNTTSYTLTITNQRGCQYSASLPLTVWPRVYTPSAFSPNGDNENDVWKPENLDQYPNAELFIYNRWGELVYSHSPGAAPFDGTLRGEPLPAGTYVYRLRLNFRGVEAAGTISLLR